MILPLPPPLHEEGALPFSGNGTCRSASEDRRLVLHRAVAGGQAEASKS